MDPIGLVQSSVDLIIAIHQLAKSYRSIGDDLMESIEELRRKTKYMKLWQDCIRAYAESTVEPGLIDVEKFTSDLLEMNALITSWAIKLHLRISPFSQEVPVGLGKLLVGLEEAEGSGAKLGDLDSELQHDVVLSKKSKCRCRNGAKVIIGCFSLAYYRVRVWLITRKDEAAFLYEGRDAVQKMLQRLRTWEESFHNYSELLSQVTERHRTATFRGLDSGTHAAVPFIFEALERAENKCAIRTISRRRIMYDLVDLDETRKSGIRMIKTSALEGADLDAVYILDRPRIPENNPRARNMEEEAAEAFVRLFHEDSEDNSDAAVKDTGLLRCWGYAADRLGNRPLDRIDCILRLPRGTISARTLRSILTDPEQPSMKSRVRFAIKLADSMLALFAMGIVHKNIRPESILVVKMIGYSEDDQVLAEIGMPYLIGFDQCRPEGAQSGLKNPQELGLSKVVYDHPSLLTTGARLRKYQMLDDIYSYGATLLEILLWVSFFRFEDDDWYNDTDVLPLNDRHYEDLGVARANWPSQRRKDLIAKAQELRKMSGDTLPNTVVSCLKCWEEWDSSQVTRDVRGDYELKMEGRQVLTATQQASHGIRFVTHVLVALRDYLLHA